MTVAEWAEKHRYLSSETSALPGRYSLQITPYLRGVLEAFTDRSVRKIVCQKSAQVGWTDGFLNNVLGYSIHIAPAPFGILFPRDQNAKDYNAEKFTPMVEATPVLNEIVNVKSRSADNTQNRKKYPGGFLKLFGSNSTGGVKSTPLKYVAVEEPDDCNLNIKGQGDSIKLAEERIKTFHDGKILAGGTPSIKGVSSIAAEMELSDKRYFMVPCHECGHAHALDWEHVHWDSDPESPAHSVFGHSRPETACYQCPHCEARWNDARKNANVRWAERAGHGWKATAEFRGVAGFYLNELYSPFKESSFVRLVEKYLEAKHEFDRGDQGALITFWNSTRGLPYEYITDLPKADELRSRAEDYAEFTVPCGGLVLTAGVDVQPDRLAVVIRAWGRGEESWLVYWGELTGDTVRPDGGPWKDLEQLLFRDYAHASGARLRIRAMTVDTGDGDTTQDAAYTFCRKHLSRGVMAGKGASERVQRDGKSRGAGDERREIYSAPRPAVDADRKHKAWKYGLRPHIVGTSRAKDLLIDARLKFKGSGAGVMHWYADVRTDYWEQITAEIKAPHPSVKNVKVWQRKSGCRNEALDCEVYALHAARSLKTHLIGPHVWAAIDAEIRQASLFSPAEPVTSDDLSQGSQERPPPAQVEQTQPAAGGFSFGRGRRVRGRGIKR